VTPHPHVFINPEQPSLIIDESTRLQADRRDFRPRSRFVTSHRLTRHDHPPVKIAARANLQKIQFRFCQSDPSVPHDHPWHFLSFVIRGRYREITEARTIVRRPGSVAFRRATCPHRVELLGHPVTTVIITGPHCRPWGFWCPRPAQPPAFVPWQQFGSGGCGEYHTPPTRKGTRTQ
jgi:quercetin dioxygenase-like cupin family protein